MKLDSTLTIEEVKRGTLKLLNSTDELLVVNITEDYLASDFLMPNEKKLDSIVPVNYYGWDMAYARLQDGTMGYTFKSSSIAGGIGTTPGLGCGNVACALRFSDYDHNSTDFMCGYYSVVEFVPKR